MEEDTAQLYGGRDCDEVLVHGSGAGVRNIVAHDDELEAGVSTGDDLLGDSVGGDVSVSSISSGEDGQNMDILDSASSFSEVWEGPSQKEQEDMRKHLEELLRMNGHLKQYVAELDDLIAKELEGSMETVAEAGSGSADVVCDPASKECLAMLETMRSQTGSGTEPM